MLLQQRKKHKMELKQALQKRYPGFVRTPSFPPSPCGSHRHRHHHDGAGGGVVAAATYVPLSGEAAR